MISKEEIEKAIDDFNFFYEGDYITKEMSRSKDIVKEYIEELEKRLCNHDEIISRLEEDNTRKDKKIKELEADNYECNNIINDFIDERRELIEKLEEDIEIFREKMKDANWKLDKLHYMKRIEYAQEILSIVKGE